jgi:lipopolysaccharide transport system permease protein
MVLMFLTPIFFPLSAVPESFRNIIKWSPLSIAVEGIRGLIFWERLPSLTLWLVYFFICWMSAWLGYLWFMKTKKGFADVI